MVIKDKIDLRKQRDFTELFNLVFYLIRTNFKLISSALFMVGGPFVLLYAVITGILQINLLSGINDLSEILMTGKANQYLTNVISNNIIWILATWLIGLLTFSFVRAVMINFIILYDAKQNGEELTASEIASNSFRDGFTIFVNVLALTLLAVLPLFALIFSFIFSIGSNTSLMLLAFLIILSIIAFGPQLTYIFLFSTWFSLIRDKISLSTALKNTFRNIKGNFWWVWVLMVSMFFLVSILNYFTSLPATEYFQNHIVKKPEIQVSESIYTYLLLFVIAQIGSFLFQCLGDLLSYLTFFSLEEAGKKEELTF